MAFAMEEHTPVSSNGRNSMAALRPVFSSLIYFFHYKNARRSLNLLAVFVLLSLVVSNARGASYSMVLISHTPGGAESTGQSDYASVAYGGDGPDDPYPVMVFSSLSTDLTSTIDKRTTETADQYLKRIGVTEGDGSGSEQEYDVFTYDEVNSRMELISHTWEGSQGGSDGESVLASIGGMDLDLAVFQSSASNLLVNADNNYKTDIFLVDLRSLESPAELVSKSWYGPSGGDNHSGNTLPNGLTHNGNQQLTDWHKPASVYRAYKDNVLHKFVVYESLATNLDEFAPLKAGVTAYKQIYVRDMLGPSQLLTRNYSNQTEVEWGNGDSWQPMVSLVAGSEGKYVVFVSNATNLVPGDTNGLSDIFLLNTSPDEGEQRMTLISRKWNCDATQCAPGALADGVSTFPSFSQDGRYIVFQSKASNLLSDATDTQGVTQIYLYDTQYDPQMDPDHRNNPLRIVSMSSYLKGIEQGEADTPGHPGNLPSYNPVVVSSDTGAQVVVFTSYATNLIEGDTNDTPTCNMPMEGHPTTNCPDIFVHDFNKQQTWRVSFATDGQESMANSGWPTLSGNGRFVYFTSIARLLGNGEYTGQRQIFRRDQGNPPGNPNLQPTSWTFAEVNLSEEFVSPKRTFRIAALAPITVAGLHMEKNTNFSILAETNTCFKDAQNLLMDAGDECTFQIKFTPTQTGVVWDKVQIDLLDDNAGMHDRTIEARVTGKATSMFYFPLVFFGSKP
jgi:hypothetical protein